MKTLIKKSCLSQKTENIGSFIKSSKIKNTWELILEDKDFIIELYYSKLSNKILVLINSEVFDRKILEGKYRFECRIQLHILEIEKKDKHFHLYIDGFKFKIDQRQNRDENKNVSNIIDKKNENFNSKSTKDLTSIQNSLTLSKNEKKQIKNSKSGFFLCCNKKKRNTRNYEQLNISKCSNISLKSENSVFSDFSNTTNKLEGN